MTDTVKVGDAVVHQVLHAAELQHLIRQVGGPDLQNAIVNTPSQMTPWVVDIEGALFLEGQPHFWSIPVDMREVKSADAILYICGELNKSFAKASDQLRRPA